KAFTEVCYGLKFKNNYINPTIFNFKSMKNKFKLCVMAALALFVGVTSCSKGDSDLADGQKKVRVRIDLAGVQSRAVGNETAKDEMPDFSDLKLFFVGSGIVQHVETITSS